MTKILIAGIGGVGGYFGGMLARQFYSDDKIEISFFARGAHLKEIQKNGLTIINGKDSFIAHPKKATDIAPEIGIVDLLIICTKSYDLEKSLEQLRSCVNNNTVILPLLNGVDSRERIEKVFPENLVADGCVYIVSRLKQPGVVENSGNIQTLFFGKDGVVNNKLKNFESLFKEAGIEATLSPHISSVIWEKFIFISPTASATSYFDNCIGELLLDDKKRMVMLLVEEVKQLALAKGIKITDDVSERTLQKLKALPFETTSSMHSDFKSNKGNTELMSLTGYVVNESRRLNLPVPNYEKVFEKLSQPGYFSNK